MAYEDYCAACTYLGESADYNGKYFCERKCERMYASSAKCSSYCEAYSRSNNSRSNMIDNSNSHISSSGCYITTIVTELLGMSDDNYYLNTLRKYRDNYLLFRKRYYNLLLEYDIVGPVISNKIMNDSNRINIANELFNKYIKPAVIYIEYGKNEMALYFYKDMTNSLKEYYNIDSDYFMQFDNIQEADLNISYLGHGNNKSLSRKKTKDSI